MNAVLKQHKNGNDLRLEITDKKQNVEIIYNFKDKTLSCSPNFGKAMSNTIVDAFETASTMFVETEVSLESEPMDILMNMRQLAKTSVDVDEFLFKLASVASIKRINNQMLERIYTGTNLLNEMKESVGEMFSSMMDSKPESMSDHESELLNLLKHVRSAEKRKQGGYDPFGGKYGAKDSDFREIFGRG